MRIRPVYCWWCGLLLFAPSIFIWIFEFVPALRFYGVNAFPSPDRDALTHFYLPLFAAIVGFTVPILALRLLRTASWRNTAAIFSVYLAVMVVWGVIDIQHHHSQERLDYDSYSRHSYWTWYFMPFNRIQPGIRG